MSKNASRDNNFVPTKIAVLNTDGKTLIPLQVDPVSHHLETNDATTGSDKGPTNALRDQNNVPTLIGVSSADFKTPVVCYADSSGDLLINSN